MKTIETERLILTPWTESREDAEGLYAYAKDPDVGPNAGWKPHESIEESAMIIKEMFIPETTWAIREKETGKIVGSIGLMPDRRREDVNSREMGYSLAKDCWGKGYMTEAVNKVVSVCFEDLMLNRVEAGVIPTNVASKNVMKKIGFTYIGTSSSYLKINGIWQPHEIYEKINPNRKL